VYGDLIYLADHTYMLFVDDCIRASVFIHVDYKTYESLEKGFRRGWIARFGPPAVMRIDKERALSHDSFGTYLETLGTVRELVDASDEHTRLSILDRRVQLIRSAGPILLDELASKGLAIEPEDLAAELEYVLNTQMSHSGVCHISASMDASRGTSMMRSSPHVQVNRR